MKPIEIVDLPTENGDFPTSYVAVYQRVYWLVVWKMIFLMTFHSVGNVIIPTDELIFFRGVGIPPSRLSDDWGSHVLRHFKNPSRQAASTERTNEPGSGSLGVDTHNEKHQQLSNV